MSRARSLLDINSRGIVVGAGLKGDLLRAGPRRVLGREC